MTGAGCSRADGFKQFGRVSVDMSLRGIGYLYVFMVALIFVSLHQGSLPEEFDMSFLELFSYFFGLITVCTGGMAFLIWWAQSR